MLKLKGLRMELYICYGCDGSVHHKGFDKRVKEGSLRRVKLKGEFRTFHKECFKTYCIENPDWFNDI